MEWRGVIVGAVASLLVTVLGGVGVFYATKEPDEKKNEKLVFSLSEPARFTGGVQDVAFSSIKVENVGGVVAKQVAVRLSFSGAVIRDQSIDASLGLKESKNDRTDKGLVVVYDRFLPGESVTFNLLLSKAERPVVDVRSETSLGVERDSLPGLGAKQVANSVLSKVVPLTGILASLGALAGIVFLRRVSVDDRNNTGFLLMHQGLISDAETVLRAAVMEGEHHQIALSNFALSKALAGEMVTAKALLKAAKFQKGQQRHTRAVVAFNEGLIELLQGNKDEAKGLLKAAISLSPREVRNYCQWSVHLDSVRSDPSFHELFGQS